jgi:hypothetical protein
MPRFTIVIADAKVAHDKEIERNISANLVAYCVDKMTPIDASRTVNAITSIVRDKYQERPEGTVHVEAIDSACPDGLPNCRNCGDPAHAESCAAAGHCPACCDLRHGIGPDSLVAANGYRLEPAE